MNPRDDTPLHRKAYDHTSCVLMAPCVAGGANVAALAAMPRTTKWRWHGRPPPHPCVGGTHKQQRASCAVQTATAFGATGAAELLH